MADSGKVGAECFAAAYFVIRYSCARLFQRLFLSILIRAITSVSGEHGTAAGWSRHHGGMAAIGWKSFLRRRFAE